VSRYTVRLLAQVAREVEVEASSPAEAVRLAREQESLVGVVLDAPTLALAGFASAGVKLKPDAVAQLGDPDEDGAPIVLDEWHVTGGCEACEVPLFESDDYYSGEVDLCRSCADCAAGQVHADEEPVAGGDA
jgi:hypothetical protein